MPRTLGLRGPSRLASLIAPPGCAVCRAASKPDELLCGVCVAELGRGSGRSPTLPGLDGAWAPRPYSGSARRLVAALKFQRLLPVARGMAELIAAEAPDGFLNGALVPVPADPVRRMLRGFDPAELLAIELSGLTEASLRPCLRRRHGARQVGRSRGERLAAPPRVRIAAPPPDRAVLVDDVVTTGATLSACARELRAAGAAEVRGIAFAASGLPLGVAPARA